MPTGLRDVLYRTPPQNASPFCKFFSPSCDGFPSRGLVNWLKGGSAIKTVIYLDVLLLTNFALGAVFLLTAGLLSGQRCAPCRVVLGALASAAASLALLAPEVPAPLALIYKGSTAAAAVAAAYGWPGPRAFGQLLAWFLALNLALAGALLLPGAQSNNLILYLPLSPGGLLAGAGGVWLAVQGLQRFLAPRSACLPLELELCGATLCLRGYYDTGFTVREPLSGRGVVLVRDAAALPVLPPDVRTYLEAALSGQTALPPSGRGFRLVPCDTIAGHCLLPALPATLHMEGQHHRGLYAAFCSIPPPPSGWEALIGPL